MEASTVYHRIVYLMAGLALICMFVLIGPEALDAMGKLKKDFFALDRQAIALTFMALFMMLAVCGIFGGAVAEDQERKERLAEQEIAEKQQELAQQAGIRAWYEVKVCDGQCMRRTRICHRCYDDSADMSHYYRNDVIPPVRRSTNKEQR